MKNIKNIKKSQQVSKQKKKKGRITRHNASLISIRNALYSNLTKSASHARAQEILSLIKDLRSHEKKMLNKLLAKTIYSSNLEIARKYFQKMIDRGSKTISNLIRLFEELDLIRVDQFIKKVCIFTIGPAALNEIIRNTLMPYLTPLRLLVRLSPLLLTTQVQTTNYPQYNMKYLNNCSINTKNMRKRELVMIKSLELTDAGRINLSVFPTSAIAIADKKLITTLQKGVTVANPFEFLCKVAHGWCKENNVQPEYRAMFQALEHEGFTKDTQKFTRILVSKAMATNNYAQPQAIEKKTNSVPNIGRDGACCYYRSANNETKRIYLKRQLGTCKFDENGTPIPICKHTLNKLTCNHN